MSSFVLRLLERYFFLSLTSFFYSNIPIYYKIIIIFCFLEKKTKNMIKNSMKSTIFYSIYVYIEIHLVYLHHIQFNAFF